MSADAVHVLVVDEDPSVRRSVRAALELDGLSVLEAASLAQARALLHRPVVGVVLDRELPDGDGLDLLPELRDAQPAAQVVVHSDLGADGGDVPAVARGDVPAILGHLGGRGARVAPLVGPAPLALADTFRTRVDDVADEWCELCMWDPELPPDNRPAVIRPILVAISDALERPQPIGWGLDPALEPAVEALALNAASLDEAMSQLVCLREAFERRAVEALPPEERSEANHRLNMLMLRMMTVVARFGVAQLQAEAYTDPLTGLLNRRAFERDLEREVARARRHRSSLAVAMLDVDQLKRVNDQRGHAEGDKVLRAVAVALNRALRAEDAAYRVGGDEFAIILPDAESPESEVLLDRLRAAGAPPCTVGTATFPDDDLDHLVAVADRRLYERRGRRR